MREKFCITILFLLYFVISGQYLNLDKDHNGMLSKQELSRYGTGTLTSVFLDRVFQECLTYDGEMVSQSIKLKPTTVNIVQIVDAYEYNIAEYHYEVNSGLFHFTRWSRVK